VGDALLSSRTRTLSLSLSPSLSLSLSLSLSTHTRTPSQDPSSPLCYVTNAGDALLSWVALTQLAAFGMPVACGWGVLAEVRAWQ
jgi:hypothetical protein